MGDALSVAGELAYRRGGSTVLDRGKGELVNGEPGERVSSLPDLTDVPLDEILHGTDSVLANALRRVLQQAVNAEPPISAYQSGAQFFPADDDGR
jgi:FXSXX-COOH protein